MHGQKNIKICKHIRCNVYHYISNDTVTECNISLYLKGKFICRKRKTLTKSDKSYVELDYFDHLLSKTQ